MIRALDEASFDVYVGDPAVVCFVRGREPVSRDLLTLVEALAADQDPRVGFASVEVDQCPVLAARFEIDTIPTVILFYDYRTVGRVAAPVDRAVLEQLLATRFS